jgi:hypothetical protein
MATNHLRSNWTREELAEFDLIKASFARHGIAVETNIGLSDEGDPWFVFCDADGDVLLHTARIGGLNHRHCPEFASPMVRSRLRSFVRDHPLRPTSLVSQTNVIAFAEAHHSRSFFGRA